MYSSDTKAEMASGMSYNPWVTQLTHRRDWREIATAHETKSKHYFKKLLSFLMVKRTVVIPILWVNRPHPINNLQYRSHRHLTNATRKSRTKASTQTRGLWFTTKSFVVITKTTTPSTPAHAYIQWRLRPRSREAATVCGKSAPAKPRPPNRQQKISTCSGISLGARHRWLHARQPTDDQR